MKISKRTAVYLDRNLWKVTAVITVLVFVAMGF